MDGARLVLPDVQVVNRWRALVCKCRVNSGKDSPATLDCGEARFTALGKTANARQSLSQLFLATGR